MAAADPRKLLDDVFANLQLRLINQRLSDIDKEKEEKIRKQRQQLQTPPYEGEGHISAPLVRRSGYHLDGMDRRSPDYGRYSRYGRQMRPYHVDPLEYRPVLPSHGTFVNNQPPPQVVPPPPPPNNKVDVMEMLLLQGAQMHQAVMQQLMLSSIRPAQNPVPAFPPAPVPQQSLHPPVPQAPAPATSGNGDVLVPLSIVDRLQAVRPADSAGSRRWDPAGRRESGSRRGSRPVTRREEQERRTPKFNEQLIPLSLAQELLHQRPPSIHHHHHNQTLPVPETTRPSPSPVYISRPEVRSRHAQTSLPSLPPTPRTPVQLPPVNTPTWVRRPVEVPPLALPSARRSVTPVIVASAEEVQQSPKPEPQQEPEPQTTKEETPPPPPPSLPFPGPLPLRRFRQAAYAVQFCERLAICLERKREEEDFQFAMRLREMGQAMKRISSDSKGDIMACIRRVTPDGATDLGPLLTSGGPQQKDIFGKIMDIVIDLVDIICEIMPTNGVLGVGHKSSIYQLVQNGVQFPVGYLWELEEDLLSFDGDGRTKDVGEQAGTVLILGLLVARGLVLMVLLAPTSLPFAPPLQAASKQASNMKVLASIFMVIVMEAYQAVFKKDKKEPLRLPGEVAQQLYTLDELKKFTDMKSSSINKAEKRLRQWAATYFKKLSQLNKAKR